MVWIVKGTLANGADDDPNILPAFTEHYLRPDRLYRAGRLSPFAKAYDFRIKTNTIPKNGLWDVSTGAWSEELVNDDPDNPGNEKSYPIVLTPYGKPGSTLLTRGGVESELPAGHAVDLVSGDYVSFLKRYHFTFTWEPIILCVDKFPKGSKPKYIKNAISAGVKISTSSFAPHHTHLIRKGPLEPDIDTHLAAMYARPITSLKWVDLFFEATRVPDRPVELPSPSPELAGQQKMEATEAELLKLNPDIGADYDRYWGHSALEKDWTSLPSTAGMLSIIPKLASTYSAEGWCTPNEKRSNFFDDVLVISMRGEPNRYDTDDKAVVQAGRGGFLALSPLDVKNNPVDTAKLVLAINKFHASFIADKNRTASEYRLCIIRPALMTDSRVDSASQDLSQNAPEEAKISWALARVAQEFGLTKYIDRADIINAIYTVDKSSLLPPLATTASQAPPSSSASFLAADTPSAYTNPQRSTMGAPFSSIPGTHPEDQVIPPGRPGGRSLAAEPAPVAPAAPPTDPPAEPELMGPPKVVRKLTKRTHLKPRSIFDDGDPDDPFRASSEALRAGAAPSRAETAASSSYYDYNMDVSQPAAPTGPRKLKRRVGTGIDHEAPSEPLESSERSPKKARFESEEPIEEEEEEFAPTASSSQAVSQQFALAKRGRGASDSDSETEQEQVSPKKKSRTVAPNPKKADRAPVKEKAGAKAKPAPVDPKYMHVKTARRGGAAAADAAAAFDADFNALKLVKPVYAPVVRKPGTKVNWDDYDSDEARKKLQEDGEMTWGGEPTQRGKFVTKYFDIKPREPPVPRTDLAVEAKWANRPNYKAFKPKAGARLAGVVPTFVPQKVELVLSRGPDFGLGAQYREEPDRKASKKKNKKVDAISFDDDDGPVTQTQSKLNFGAARAKPAAANARASSSKGKSRAIVQDSDEEDELATPSATYNQDQDRMDLDSDEEDQLASQKSAPKKAAAKTTARKPAAATASSSKTKATPAVKAKAPAKAKAIPKKRAQETDSDSDEGFQGLTWTAGVKRK